MSVHLDTNIAIGLINRTRPEYRLRIHRSSQPVLISAVVAFELWYGAANGDRFADDARALRLFLDSIPEPLPFTQEDAHAAGEIRATLQKAGTPIGPYDLLIAAHAVRRNATLITANTREFSKVPGLVWEDWSVA